MRILILGGTSEASALAGRLAGRRDVSASLSLAGRTRDPAPQPLPTRVGGFGGVDGLVAHLRAEAVDLLIDATHPFAAVMSQHAAAAAAIAGVPLVRFTRAPWMRQAGDRWTEVASIPDAVAALGPAPRRVLVTTGRLGLAAFAAAPWHRYLIRTIDPPEGLALPDARIILDRGPFDEGSERELMRTEAIELLVTKNSGGAATYGKIAAARALGLPVILVAPPAGAGVRTVHALEAMLSEIDAHAGRRAERGV